jgi:hypothetical protein
MNRRTFLAGLATTTAIVAAGAPALPAPPVTAPKSVTIKGRLGAGGYVRWQPFYDATRLNQLWTARLDSAVRPDPLGDDLRLYGVAFQRLPGGERIDPREVYAAPASEAAA